MVDEYKDVSRAWRRVRKWTRRRTTMWVMKWSRRARSRKMKPKRRLRG